MTQNKLQLNGEKTEAKLVGTKQKISAGSADSIQLGKNSISLSVSVKNLGVVLDNTLCVNKLISQTSQPSYYQLRLISCIPKYLSAEATAKLVTSLIPSRLAYCSALLCGLPASTNHGLQRILSAAQL